MADGQVTKGSEIVKPNVSHLAFCVQSLQHSCAALLCYPVAVLTVCLEQVRKVRKIGDGKAIGGFAGECFGESTWHMRLVYSHTLKKAKLHLVVSCVFYRCHCRRLYAV